MPGLIAALPPLPPSLSGGWLSSRRTSRSASTLSTGLGRANSVIRLVGSALPRSCTPTRTVSERPVSASIRAVLGTQERALHAFLRAASLPNSVCIRTQPSISSPRYSLRKVRISDAADSSSGAAAVARVATVARSRSIGAGHSSATADLSSSPYANSGSTHSSSLLHSRPGGGAMNENSFSFSLAGDAAAAGDTEAAEGRPTGLRLRRRASLSRTASSESDSSSRMLRDRGSGHRWAGCISGR